MLLGTSEQQEKDGVVIKRIPGKQSVTIAPQHGVPLMVSHKHLTALNDRKIRL